MRLRIDKCPAVWVVLSVLFGVNGVAQGAAIQNTTVQCSYISSGLTVTNSSVLGDSWAASKAIDGTLFKQSSESGYHSSGTSEASWWQVDLGEVKTIGSVQLVNRKGFTARLTNFKISVFGDDGTNEVWSGVFYLEGNVGRGEWFPIEPVQGRFIRVAQLATNDTPLTLMEVDVTEYHNLAFGMSATQSSDGAGSTAARGVDGCEDSEWTNGSITHTVPGGAVPVYFEVDLGGDCEIKEIVLVNRNDGGLGTRLSNFRVSIFDGVSEVYGENFYVGSGFAPPRLSLSGGDVEKSGDRVRVEFIGGTNNVNDILSLAELQVFGERQGITWGDPFSMNSTDETLVLNRWDESRNGGLPPPSGIVRIKEAKNYGYDGVRVNGISFSNQGGSYDYWGYAGMNHNIDLLLSGHSAQNGTKTFTLTGLVPGNIYQLQFIGIHDYRTENGLREQQYELSYGMGDFTSKGAAPILTRYGYGNVDPPNPPVYQGFVSYDTVVGTFAATADTMTYMMRDNWQDGDPNDDPGPGLCGYVLLESEPNNGIMILLH